MAEIGRPSRNLDLPKNIEDLFVNVASQLSDYLKQNYDASTPIQNYLSPDNLRQAVDFKIKADGAPFEEVINELKNVLKFSTRTGHIRFFNQLWAGTDVAAVLSEWYLSVLNTSMYTYEVAPVFTLIELDMVEKFCKLVGYEDGEGTFAPGGAHANLLGILAARQFHFPNIKTEGNGTKELVCFTSAHSHYTIPRAAAVLGIGTKGSIYVPVDREGRMIPEALDAALNKAKAEGKVPFFVNSTAGTTVYGAYDDYNAIADVCEKHKVWLHIDACWGGHCLFSSTYKSKMNGAHRAHSVALTGTKCFGLPQQCALIVLREKGILRTCNSMNADYLFHEYEEKSYDLGDLTLNCGRRVDSFKLWVSLKVHGDSGFEARTNHAFEQAAYIVEKIRESKGVLELAHNPQSLNVCFWYVPEKFRNQERNDERDAALDKITALIRRQIQLGGKVLTNFADVAGQPHFFRHITCNPGANAEDSDVVLSEIVRIGDQLSQTL